MLSLVALLALSPPFAADQCLAFVSTNLAKGNGNWFTYHRFATNQVTIREGDILEYRVFLADSNPIAKGGIDVDFDGQALRDSGAVDENGLRAHGDALLPSAVGKWLTRRMSLERLVGRTTRSWNVAFEGDVDGKYAQFIDDVAVKRKDGSVISIYSDGKPPADELLAASGYSKMPYLVAVDSAGVSPATIRSLVADVEAIGKRIQDLKAARDSIDLAKKFVTDPRVLEHVSEADGILKTVEAGEPSAKDIENALHRVRNALQHTHPVMEQFTGHLVGHAHIDLQWLWEWQEGIVATERTFAQAVKFMDEYPGFTFSQSSACLYKTIEERYPELFNEIKERIAKGQWELVGGRICEGDLNMISHESHARHFLYAQRYFREKLGKTAVVGWEPDTFGHTAQMPQILKQGGCDYYYFCRGGKGKPLFWWKGLDGSRVLAFDEPATGSWYSSDLSYKQFQEMINFQKSANSKDSLWVYGVGNHGGGPTREMIEWALEQMKTPGRPTIKFSTATEFFKKLETYDLKGIPTVTGDLNPVFEGGYTTHSRVKQLNRDAEASTTSAESVSAVAYLFGFNYPAQVFRQSWEDICFNHHHDTLPGTGIHSSYQKTYTTLERVIANNKDISMRALEMLSLRVTPKSGGMSVLVFNPLGWERGGWVETHLIKSGWDGGQALNIDRLVAEEPGGTDYPVQVVDRKTNLIRFYAGSVPAFGYAVFQLRSATDLELDHAPLKVSQGGYTIESQFQKVMFNPKGGFISELHSKDMGTQSAKALGRLEVHWEDGGNAWVTGRVNRVEPLAPYSSESVTGKDFVDVIFKYRIAAWNTASKDSTITQRFRVYDYLDIEVEVTCDWNGVGTSQQPNATLKAVFETPFVKGRTTYAVPFGALTNSGDNKEFAALQWVHISDGDAGLAIFNDSKHGFSSDKSTIRMSLIRSTHDPDPVPDAGTHTWKYQISATTNDWQMSRVPRRGAEFNQPLMSVTVPYDAHGNAPNYFSAVKLDPVALDNVVPTALKLAEDGNSLVLRMFESGGEPFNGHATFGINPKSAEEVNFLEDRIGAAATEAAGMRITLKPWEIKSYKLSIPKWRRAN